MEERRRFELVRELGSGTFGTVYLADMVSLGGFRKRVALKMLNPQWEEGSDAGQRLRDEARLLGRLRHRHIVSVDDLVRVNGRWGVVMEYVPGVDLERLILGAHSQGTTIPLAPSLDIIAAAAEALRAAFEGGLDGEALQVIHRDIKPSNILLTTEGDVKVLDFGIASASFQGREAKTGRVRFGSIPYMSPERVLGEPEIPAGDVYALGCVLYELLIGTRLGRAELGPDRQEAQVAEALQALQDQLESPPAELLSLVEDCLKYDVENRPSAGDVASRARALGRTLSGDGLHAFARDFVPAILEETAQPTAHGVFSEEMPPAAAAASNPTLILPDELMGDPDDSAPVAAPTAASALLPSAEPASAPAPPPSTTPPLLPFIAVGIVIAMLAGGLGVVWQQRQADAPTPPLTAPLEVPVIAPEPPAEPPVVAAPVVEAVAEEAPPVAEEPAEQPAAPVAEPEAPPRPVADSSPAQPVSEPVTVAEPAEDAPRLRSVKFTAPAGAAAISARCGDVSSNGTGSVNLRNIPAGSCSVTVTVDGSTTSTTLTVERPAGFTCALDGGALTCR